MNPATSNLDVAESRHARRYIVQYDVIRSAGLWCGDPGQSVAEEFHAGPPDLVEQARKCLAIVDLYLQWQDFD